MKANSATLWLLLWTVVVVLVVIDLIEAIPF